MTPTATLHRGQCFSAVIRTARLKKWLDAGGIALNGINTGYFIILEWAANSVWPPCLFGIVAPRVATSFEGQRVSLTLCLLQRGFSSESVWGGRMICFTRCSIVDQEGLVYSLPSLGGLTLGCDERVRSRLASCSMA